MALWRSVALVVDVVTIRFRVTGAGGLEGTSVICQQQPRQPLTPLPEPAERLMHSVLSLRTCARSPTALLPLHAPMLEDMFASLFARVALPHGCDHVPALQQLHGLAIDASGAPFARFDEHVRTLRHTFRSARGADQGTRA